MTPQPHLLIIEDDDLQFEIYEDALAKFKLTRAKTGSAALALLRYADSSCGAQKDLKVCLPVAGCRSLACGPENYCYQQTFWGNPCPLADGNEGVCGKDGCAAVKN